MLSVACFIAGLLFCYFFAWFFCTCFVWQPDDPLYILLKSLQSTSPFWIMLIVLLVVAAITYYYLAKPLRYLDEVVAAAEKLSRPSESSEPILLPHDLEDVQNELNLVREQALRSMAAEREAEQRKNDMIVYLAHDLKTPLTSVIGYLTLLSKENGLPEEARKRYLATALEKSERLEELINEFFDITRFSLTSIELEKSTIDLTLMLEQIAYEFSPVLAERKLSLRTELERDVKLLCDPDKLERVFDNLLRNAASYSLPDSEIEITLGRQDGYALVSFRNHSEAIPKEKLSRLFDQFYRLDSSRSGSTGGAGLGLAIAREIVMLHGGQITARSGDGTIIFDVLLPIENSTESSNNNEN